MDFRTTIKPLANKGVIAHDGAITMLGSCFSDNIGRRLQDALFDVEVNPFGTLYNPASIALALQDLINCREFCINDLFEYQGRYHSFSHHSSFSGVNADDVISRINDKIDGASERLKRSRVLIITFGTAYVYEYKKTQSVVSNCHKLPASNFSRRSMAVDEIVSLWSKLIVKIREINPEINIIVTVSPIRHLADGAHENQLSKSTLLLAVNKLCHELDNVIYFPAYEIMMDDLRDYRFYASDMIHPSDVAIGYIYEIFSQSFFSEETNNIVRESEKLMRRLKHRHMTDDVSVIEKFNLSTQQIIDRILSAYPYLEQAINKIQV
ncbi:MAG: GSCFA domain-containing protein [Muribaculaceae bacterium]|nr:GSCFA domain-containing protein [Muribaculaceae bacterium]